jgi:predicted Na+-dependent transporter
MFASFFLPFGVGVALHALAPSLAARLRERLAVLGAAVLLVVLLVLLVRGRAFLLEFGARDYAALTLFCALALVGGHVLAEEGERTTYALESAARNPFIALLLATSSLGPVRGAVVVPYLVVLLLVTTLYSVIGRRLRARRIVRAPP